MYRRYCVSKLHIVCHIYPGPSPWACTLPLIFMQCHVTTVCSLYGGCMRCAILYCVPATGPCWLCKGMWWRGCELIDAIGVIDLCVCAWLLMWNVIATCMLVSCRGQCASVYSTLAYIIHCVYGHYISVCVCIICGGERRRQRGRNNYSCRKQMCSMIIVPVSKCIIPCNNYSDDLIHARYVHIMIDCIPSTHCQ